MERGNSSWETVFVIGLETKVCIKLIAVGMEKMMETVINRGGKDNRLEVLKHTKESTSLEQSHMQSFSQCKKKVNLLPGESLPVLIFSFDGVFTCINKDQSAYYTLVCT